MQMVDCLQKCSKIIFLDIDAFEWNIGETCNGFQSVVFGKKLELWSIGSIENQHFI